jgi:tellurite resistance protein
VSRLRHQAARLVVRAGIMVAPMDNFLKQRWGAI